MGEFIGELWAFMKERKKFWLLPIVVVLLLFGSLVGADAGFSGGTVYLYAVLINGIRESWSLESEKDIHQSVHNR